MALQLGTEVPGTPADGNIVTLWVPTIANIKAPTLDEIDAATDISNYVMLGGWNFEPSQATVSDQRENSSQDYGIPGRKSVGDCSIEVIDNTNTQREETENTAVATLTEGVEGFFLRRRGLPTDEAFAAGQKVSVVAARIGAKASIKPDENTMQRATIPFFVQAPGWEDETAQVAEAPKA